MTTAAVACHRISTRAGERRHRAAVIHAPGQVSIQEVPAPELAPGHVIVRITHCGVCASNVPPWQGRPWFSYPLPAGALGHEGTGIIDAVADDVTGWGPGDRVAFLGERGYAELESVPALSLFKLPREETNAPFLAEPMACAVNVFRRAGISEGDSVVIVGGGFLGLLLIQLAVGAGARVFALSRRPQTLNLAQHFGADPILVQNSSDAVREISNETEGRMADVVVEATGYQEPLNLAGELTRIRGRLVIAGYHQDGLRQVNMQLWNWRGIDVINAHERDPAIYIEGMRLAHEAVAAGRLTTRGLITHRFPLEELGHALDLTANRPEGFIKAVIEA